MKPLKSRMDTSTLKAHRKEGRMSTMICDCCGQTGIYWKNLTGLSPYTYCPNCGNTNCQKPEPRQEEPDDEELQEEV